MKALAIIPARSGSKRIPGKNIKLFAGKPMIAHSILAARESGLFDHIVVSTDSDEIAEVARTWGAEVPFRRPPELADDVIGVDEVFLHAIVESEKRYGRTEFACLIYATAPLLRPQFLVDGLETLRRTGASCATAAARFPYPIQRALRTGEDDRLKLAWPEYGAARSQDLPDFVHEAGQFHWVHVPRFKNHPDTFCDAVPVILPRWSVEDIDTPEDWEGAERMVAAMQNGRVQMGEGKPMNVSRLRGLKYPDEFVIRFFFKNRLDALPGNVLELGCGNGNNLLLFHGYGWNVVGLDVSRESLADAENNFALVDASGARHRLIERDLANGLGESVAGKFDVILLPNILCYLPRQAAAKVLRELRLVVKNEAFVFLRTRALRDYRFGRGTEVERNGYRLIVQETGESGLLNVFYDEQEVVDMLRDHIGLNVQTAQVLKAEFQNPQQGVCVSNSDIIVWGRCGLDRSSK